MNATSRHICRLYQMCTIYIAYIIHIKVKYVCKNKNNRRNVVNGDGTHKILGMRYLSKTK